MTGQRSGRIQATVLPQGEPITLWLVDGRITYAPQENSVDLVPMGGYLLPGLVDMHGHANFTMEELGPDNSLLVAHNLRAHAAAGTTVLRDLGSSSRELESHTPRLDEPRLIPAGQALIGVENPCFPITPPEDTVELAVSQLGPSVRWVKIFTDWPAPETEDPSKASHFLEENPLTYPLELLCEIVDKVHAQGGRVASHAFTSAGAQASILAGVDTIEHGWGIDLSMLNQMVEKGIGWVPLVGIAPPMLQLADRDERPHQRLWIEDRLDRLPSTLAAALQLNVPVMAGTDWFPFISLAEDVAMMVKLGVPPSRAIATASTTPRDYLGLSCLEEGSKADLCWYQVDPRQGPRTLVEPSAIWLDGCPVTPSPPEEPAPPDQRPHGDHCDLPRFPSH